MTLGVKDVAKWRQAFVEAVQELSETCFGGVPVTERGYRNKMPDSLLGAFVQVVSKEGAVLVGLIASSEACDGLARLMLQMEPEDEIAENDANDAMGEIINIAAGGIKTKLSAEIGAIELGLPLFLSGRLHAVGNIAVEVAEMSIGHFPCELIVFALTGK